MPLYIDMPNLLDIAEHFGVAPARYDVIIQKTLEKAAIQTQGLVMSQVPVRTGKLRQSIRYVIKKNTAVVFVDPKLSYAWAVEEGTGLHGEKSSGNPNQSGASTYIRPIAKQVMATKINPGWGSSNRGGYFIIGTKQQGQRATHFMKKGRDLAFPIVRMTFAEARQLLIKEATGK